MLLTKQLDYRGNILLRDGLSFEDTFERIVEIFGRESVTDCINLSGEFLTVAAMEMRHDPVEIRIRSKHHEITGVSFPTAVEFQRKQQLPLRNSRSNRADSL